MLLFWGFKEILQPLEVKPQPQKKLYIWPGEIKASYNDWILSPRMRSGIHLSSLKISQVTA
jgi:hypothetical protein